MKMYRKKSLQPARPYVEGEDMSGISVSDSDQPPQVGGMIANNPQDPEDQWFIAEQFFTDNYVEVAPE